MSLSPPKPDVGTSDDDPRDAPRDPWTRAAAQDDEPGRKKEAPWPWVYDELRRMARRQMIGGGATLQPTALVHEAYLRLADNSEVAARGRAYFFASAARAMRLIAIDHARARSCDKRGGREAPLTLQTRDAEVDRLADDVLDLHAALERLEKLNPRQAQVVECRYFGGLDQKETAEALGTSTRTVKRDWALARAWLYRELNARSASR